MPLGLFLIAVSLNDWLSGNKPGTDRKPKSLASNIAYAAVFATVAAVITHVPYQSWTATLLTVVTLTIGSALWSGLRYDVGGSQKGWLAITALASTLVIGGMVMPAVVPDTALATSTMYAHLTAYFVALPWHQLDSVNPELVILLVGTMLFLGPTGNAIVRTVMIQIRSVDYDASEQQLKGGRYIGPLERWLIFGLALAGQPTAAALVISAKSIIRFPELQSKADRPAGNEATTAATGDSRALSIDELTEYFLIGSLLSWMLALLAALPLTATGTMT